MTSELDAAGRCFPYFVCNPTMRELAGLPADRSDVNLVGFYRHAPTAEYRVLSYKCNSSVEHHYEYLVVVPVQQSARKLMSTIALTYGHYNWMLNNRPMFHPGCLHWTAWPRQEWIVVFDTISEEFRRMRGPMDGDAGMDLITGWLVGVECTLGTSVFVKPKRTFKAGHSGE
jgi:hypothetical protein